MTRSPRLWAWGPFLVWALVVLAVSSVPQALLPVVGGGRLLDKWAHAAEFAVLGLLAARGLKRDPWIAGRWIAFPAALLGLAALGVVDEWHQRLIPGRQFEWFDAAADALGAAAGLALGAALWRRTPPSQAPDPPPEPPEPPT